MFVRKTGFPSPALGVSLTILTAYGKYAKMKQQKKFNFLLLFGALFRNISVRRIKQTFCAGNRKANCVINKEIEP